MQIEGMNGQFNFSPRTMAVMASINLKEILIMGGQKNEEKFGDAWILNLETRKPRMTRIYDSKSNDGDESSEFLFYSLSN